MATARALWSLVLLCHVTTVTCAGPRCHTCNKVSSARDCATLMQCGEHEKCYSQKFIAADTHTYFRLGCIDKNVCAQSIPVIGKRGHDWLSRRQTPHEYVMCTQCCDGTLCNANACGANTSSTGLKRCFECTDVNDPHDCDRVVECGNDHQCYVHRGPSHMTFIPRYDMGCMPSRQCHTAMTVYQHKGCMVCCNGDYCNLDACDHYTVDGQWTNWSPWTSCSASCGRGEAIRVRSCTNPPPQNGGKPCEQPDTTAEIKTCIESCTAPTTTRVHTTTTKPPPTTTTTTTTTPKMTTERAPTITITPGHVITRPYQQPVTATCKTDIGTAAWTYNSHGTMLPKGAHANGGTLTIDSLNEANNGTYRCVAVSPTGLLATDRVHVNIQTISAIAVQVSLQSNGPLHPNDKFALRCTVLGYPIPTVTWEFQNSQGAPIVPSNVQYTENDRVLTIQHYNPAKHDGNWTCKANNGFGDSTATNRVP